MTFRHRDNLDDMPFGTAHCSFLTKLLYKITLLQLPHEKINIERVTL